MTSRGDPRPMPCMSQKTPPLRFPHVSEDEDDKPSFLVFRSRRSPDMTPRKRCSEDDSVNFYPRKEARFDAPTFVESADTYAPHYSSQANREFMVPRHYPRTHVYPRALWRNHSPARSFMLERDCPRSYPSPYYGYRQFPSTSPLPEEFVPPYHTFASSPSHAQGSSLMSGAKVTPPRPENSNSSEQDAAVGDLRESDIVCGRGAPTNFQRGNHDFRKLVSEYQTVYLCSKRSDKPKIALEVMQVLKDRKARFVRRVKTSNNGRFGWEEIDERRAYEKVCQALREGAPEFRQKMLEATQVVHPVN